MIVIRADGGGSLGSGHIMRCSAVAREVLALGGEVLFAVSDEVSAKFVGSVGFQVEVLAGDRWALGDRDGAALGAFAAAKGARSVLVDSYAVSNRFFEGYRQSSRGIPVGYVDDLYSFADGMLAEPSRLDVDMVLNYMFGFSGGDYRRAYPRGVDLLIGSSFAPVCREFAAAAHDVRSGVGRILVTTGSTNPNGSLERLVLACRSGAPGVAVDIVVGVSARFDVVSAGGEAGLIVHRGINDLAPLMANADIAVSAGGTTLYELVCAGVPTIAVPIVENQVRNVSGFSATRCGIGFAELDWGVDEVSCAVSRLVRSSAVRGKMARNCLSTADGEGAARIANYLLAASEN